MTNFIMACLSNNKNNIIIAYYNNVRKYCDLEILLFTNIHINLEILLFTNIHINLSKTGLSRYPQIVIISQ